MACYDTGDFTCTYDSQVAEGKDYSILATWEADSDNDLSGTGITTLDCYDSQQHEDGNVTVADATNTDETHFRRIRSAPGCSTPFAGTRTTGAQFVQTAAAERYGLNLNELHSRVENLSWKKTSNTIYGTSCINIAGDDTKAINIIIYDTANTGAGSTGGISIEGNNCLAFQCIADNNETVGISLFPASGETQGAVCCTSVNNTDIQINSGSFAGPAIAWSNYAGGSGGAAYGGTDAHWSGNGASVWGGWNAGDDTTADDAGGGSGIYYNSLDLTTGGELDSTNYLPTESIDWDGGSGVQAGRNPINDLSANWNPEGFFTTDPLAGKDIAGNTRPAGVDAAWDVGAGEFVGVIGGIVPILEHHYRMMRNQ